LSNKTPDTNAPSLPEVRAEIDSLDSKLLGLLAERQRLAELVIRAKHAAGSMTTIRDEARERDVIRQRIAEARPLGLEAHFVTKIFHELIGESLRLQQDFLQRKLNGSPIHSPVRITYRGIDGSYCHLAGKGFFNASAARSGAPTLSRNSFVGCQSFEAVVQAVESGDCDFGVMPIENTTSGAMNEVYDLLVHSQVSIVGEEKFLVRHCLIGTEQVPPSHLKRIYCTPLSVSECGEFLGGLPECALEFSTDAAVAVKRLKEDGERLHAAIASEEAAEMFGLAILQPNIGNQEDNFTRYLILAKNPVRVDSRIPAKTSIVIHTPNETGALVEALHVFRKHGINLSKLESRPVPSNPWEEMFYIDFVGNLESPGVSPALAEIGPLVRSIKVLGCYPACDIEPVSEV
jgi:chorismate mutase/prephenate dehydratase